MFRSFLSSPLVRSWKFWLVSILILSAFTRFWKLGDIQEYVFDEVYHGFTAKMYALNRYEAWVWWESPPDGVAYEWTHPPLAKVIMSWGIELFGGPGDLPTKVSHPDVTQTQVEMDAEKKTTKILTPQSFGWRFFSALFGVLATLALYLLTSSLFKNKWVGVLSAFIFTFDLLPLVQSRTAMNDIFAVTFILFGFYFFTMRKNLLDRKLSWWQWILTGMCVGGAIASKWTALFTIGILGAYQVGTIVYTIFMQKPGRSWRSLMGVLGIFISQSIYMLASLIILPYIIYMLSYWQLFTVPIYDYKGNSLAEAQENKVWETERDTLQSELRTAQVEKRQTADIQQQLSSKKRQIAFWSWLSSVNSHFADRYFIWWGVQKQMWWYHTNLKATHNYTSQWWTWPLDIRPVWFYVKYCTNPADRSDPVCAKEFDSTQGTKTIADIYTMGNPVIFWLILPLLSLLGLYISGKYRVWFYSLIPGSALILADYALHNSRADAPISIASQVTQILQNVLPQIFLFSILLVLLLTFVQIAENLFRSDSQTLEDSTATKSLALSTKDTIALFICLLAFCGYWLPWARSPRIMFFYHFFPPVTFFYPLLAYLLYRIAAYSVTGRKVVIGYLILVAVVFGYFYPHVTGWQVTEPQREQYYWLKSWK